jgi:hypothetical protein
VTRGAVASKNAETMTKWRAIPGGGEPVLPVEPGPDGTMLSADALRAAFTELLGGREPLTRSITVPA